MANLTRKSTLRHRLLRRTITQSHRQEADQFGLTSLHRKAIWQRGKVFLRYCTIYNPTHTYANQTSNVTNSHTINFMWAAEVWTRTISVCPLSVMTTTPVPASSTWTLPLPQAAYTDALFVLLRLSIAIELHSASINVDQIGISGTFPRRNCCPIKPSK